LPLDFPKATILGYLTLVLAALTIAGLLWYIYFVPYTLRVAVGPSNTEPTELLAAMSAAIERDNASVRLVLIPFANLADTSAALDPRQADLAVVRATLVCRPLVSAWQLSINTWR
jgi:hypothetical protein